MDHLKAGPMVGWFREVLLYAERDDWTGGGDRWLDFRPGGRGFENGAIQTNALQMYAYRYLAWLRNGTDWS